MFMDKRKRFPIINENYATGMIKKKLTPQNRVLQQRKSIVKISFLP